MCKNLPQRLPPARFLNELKMFQYLGMVPYYIVSVLYNFQCSFLHQMVKD